MTTTITNVTLAQRLEEAYAAVESASIRSFRTSENVLRDKLALIEAKQAILVANADDAKKLGSNEAARAATLDTMTVGERDALAGSEEEERAARHTLEIARLHLEAARAQLRLQEIAAGIARGDR